MYVISRSFSTNLVSKCCARVQVCLEICVLPNCCLGIALYRTNEWAISYKRPNRNRFLNVKIFCTVITNGFSWDKNNQNNNNNESGSGNYAKTTSDFISRNQ